MPAVSKAQQRFMGMVHAADKGETPASPEVAKVSKDMKDSDAKDFASTKHDGLPDHVKEQIKNVIREVIREKNGMNEMSHNDVHFKNIIKLYDRGGSFTRKKVGAVVCKDPRASRNDIIDVLEDADYREITQLEDELGLQEIREKYNSVNEEFKHIISVETPTQVVSKPVAAQIMALAKKGVRSNEIGLKMGFVGNQKMATDAFQKVKNQIYFALDKRNESVNEDGKLQGGEKDPCWKGYEMVGMKNKDGREVPNCVPKNESIEEEHDCGCNESHDCGCGGVHEHHIHEDLNADASGIAGLTASRASAVKDFLEKHNINSNKLYLSLKKGNLKDRLDFVTALVGKPGNPIQKKVIAQFSN